MNDHATRFARLHPTMAKLWSRRELFRIFLFLPSLVAVLAIGLYFYEGTRHEATRNELVHVQGKLKAALEKLAEPERLVCKVSNRGFRSCVVLHRGDQ